MRTLLPPTVTAALLAAWLAGCSGLRVENPPRPSAGDWLMGGGGPARTGAAPEELAPPLAPVWALDITGGAGRGGVAVLDTLVLAVNLRGELYAAGLRSGKRIGWVDLAEGFEGAPAVDERGVVLASAATNESLQSFDLVTGKREWRKAVGEIEASPLLYRNRVYAATLRGSLVCLLRSDGTELWRFDLPDNEHLKGIRSSPAADSGVVVFGADDGCVYGLDALSGTLRWQVCGEAAVTAPVAVDGGLVFAASRDGLLRAIDLHTGSLRWEERLGSELFGGPAVRADLVAIGTTDRRMLALDPATGRRLWETPLEGGVNSEPVLSGGFVYAGTLTKKLYALNASDGKAVWKVDTPGRIKTTPVVVRGTLLVPTDAQLLLAFRRAP